MKRSKIMIVLQGGMIQSVYAERATDVVICDFDIADDVEENGEPLRANVYKDIAHVTKKKFHAEAKRLWVRKDMPEDPADIQAIKKLKKLDV